MVEKGELISILQYKSNNINKIPVFYCYVNIKNALRGEGRRALKRNILNSACDL